jgi:uncharacterized ion transporter superfamily protein YfcC
MIITYILTFFIPKGIFENNVYIPKGEAKGYNFLNFIFSPIKVIASSDGLTIIVISLFILILGGAFNVMQQTNGIQAIILYLINKYKDKKYKLMYIVVLVFMLFGSLFGIFEESITLLPIILILSLSLGWDTFTGLGMCLLAAGFGFSTALTNPFSVGLGSSTMGINLLDGIWYRAIIFIIMYIVLCTFLRIHIKKIEKDPKSSPTYEADQEKIKTLKLEEFKEYDPKTLRTYTIFFLIVLLVIFLSSVIKAISGLSIPLLAVTFLIGSFACGKVIGVSFKRISKMFFDGLVAMSPAVLLLLLAGAIKFILVDSLTMDTIINYLAQILNETHPIVGILFIYALILFIQFFIASATAKVTLIIPIISILADNIGITRNIALLAFIFGDGYTDLIYPTNPVLLIALGIAGFSYTKWLKKTYVLQLIILTLTVLLLIIGYFIHY